MCDHLDLKLVDMINESEGVIVKGKKLSGLKLLAF
jgi:hypothetical protein